MCLVFSAIAGIEVLLEIARKAVFVFRTYCKKNDDFMYESMEWLPIKLVTNCDVPAITHSPNWPDQVICTYVVITWIPDIT